MSSDSERFDHERRLKNSENKNNIKIAVIATVSSIVTSSITGFVAYNSAETKFSIQVSGIAEENDENVVKIEELTNSIDSVESKKVELELEQENVTLKNKVTKLENEIQDLNKNINIIEKDAKQYKTKLEKYEPVPAKEAIQLNKTNYIDQDAYIIYLDNDKNNIEEDVYNLMYLEGWVSYYINSKYTKLTGSLGVSFVNRDTKNTGNISFIGDDELIKAYDISSSQTPIHFELDITNIKVLKIKVDADNNTYYEKNRQFYLSDLRLSP